MTNTVNVNDQQVERLRHAIESHLEPPFQEPGRWRHMSNNDLWLAVVGQVAVVGGAAGGDRLLGDQQARRELAWLLSVASSPGETRLRGGSSLPGRGLLRGLLLSRLRSTSNRARRAPAAFRGPNRSVTAERCLADYLDAVAALLDTALDEAAETVATRR